VQACPQAQEEGQLGQRKEAKERRWTMLCRLPARMWPMSWTGSAVAKDALVQPGSGCVARGHQELLGEDKKIKRRSSRKMKATKERAAGRYKKSFSFLISDPSRLGTHY